VIRELANIALLIAVVGAVAFVIAYHLLAEWRSSPLGRNIMALMAVAAVLLALGVVRAFFPVIEKYIDWFRLFGYILIAYVVWRRFFLLLQAQKVIRREETRDDRNGARSEYPSPDR
jgi:hypothetical protein